jgi:16S rRNA (cytosine1402-N4)-methyltransferase
MSELSHVPVLADEVVALLAPRPGCVMCDGTLGGGGHTRLILEAAAPDGRVIGIDRDPEALARARAALGPLAARVVFVHGTFGDLDTLLGAPDARAVAGDPPRLDGLLVDLGPSSPQLDDAERGFSFGRPGPIDMRMDPTRGETAMDLLRRVDVPELTDILRDFGEERYAPRVARHIKDAVAGDRLHTTVDLAEVIAEAIPSGSRRRMRIHPATRSFQALRIAVNGELDQLARFLEVFPALLAPGGRCAVISFHSLEDRMVKQRFRDLGWSSSLPPALAAEAGERSEPICRPITRKPVVARDDEVARNPRARSAKLRVCEKVAA